MKKIQFLLLFVISFSFAQNEKKIDSVKKIIYGATSDSLRSVENLQIANYFNHKDSVIKYLNKSLELARLAKQAKYISNSRANIANWKGKYINSKAATTENLNAIHELEKYNFYSGIANHYARLALRYDFSNKDTSKIYLNKALDISKKVKDDNLFVTLYTIIGGIKYRNADYDDALDYFMKAENICANNNLLRNSIKHADALREIGSLMVVTKKTDNAIFYMLKAKKMLNINGNTIRLIELDASLVNAYIEQQKFRLALNVINEDFNLIHNFKISDTKLSGMYQKKALCLEKLNKYNDAEFNYLKAIEISKKYNLNSVTLTNLTFLGDFYFNTDQIYKSEEIFMEAEKLYKDSDEKEITKLTRIYEGIARIKESQKKYNEALAYSQKGMKLKEMQQTKNIRLNIENLQTKFDTKKKEQQIKLLSSQNELLSSKNKVLDLQNKLAAKQTYIFLIILGLVVTIALSVFYGYRNKIKTAQKLNELNELKSRFFANISHEFRTPLTLIKSPVQSLQSETKDEKQKNKLNLIDKNANRMLDLVDQLLELSKLDSGKLQLILKDGNIASCLSAIVEPFDFQAKENNLSFSSIIEKKTENHHFDKDVIEKIVTNLLSNAFKYTSENEKVSFNATIKHNQLQLIVSNTGSDIRKEELPRLFERFYQKKEQSQGVGIGLALVNELVELYKGSIHTTLENGILSFIVTLPLQASTTNALFIPNNIASNPTEDDISIKNELPVLLIVDDNQDIRNVLTSLFKEQFIILEASDGEQALKIAQKEIPDCIISDVMMPKMNGFEFTKAIKTNELTSFIPVILLTAKTSDEAHLEGLQSTADGFLTKPFNNEIVKATVQQLITERKKLHKRYSQELVLRPADIVINSVEEKFLEKLQTVLDKELSNSDFSYEDFASMVGMSRMQLHRKLKSLLGVSASEFLRNERLKTATELLRIGNGNISEVAYAVGFNDVSYFSKCFREMYNCTPTEFVGKNNL